MKARKQAKAKAHWGFLLTQAEGKAAEAFIRKHKGRGTFHYIFTPTGIGDHIIIVNETVIRGKVKRDEKNITDYDTW